MAVQRVEHQMRLVRSIHIMASIIFIGHFNGHTFHSTTIINFALKNVSVIRSFEMRSNGD